MDGNAEPIELNFQIIHTIPSLSDGDCWGRPLISRQFEDKAPNLYSLVFRFCKYELSYTSATKRLGGVILFPYTLFTHYRIFIMVRVGVRVGGGRCHPPHRCDTRWEAECVLPKTSQNSLRWTEFIWKTRSSSSCLLPAFGLLCSVDICSPLKDQLLRWWIEAFENRQLISPYRKSADLWVADSVPETLTRVEAAGPGLSSSPSRICWCPAQRWRKGLRLHRRQRQWFVLAQE